MWLRVFSAWCYVSRTSEQVCIFAHAGRHESKTRDLMFQIVPRVVLEMSGRVQLSGGDLRTMADLLVEEALLRG